MGQSCTALTSPNLSDVKRLFNVAVPSEDTAAGKVSRGAIYAGNYADERATMVAANLSWGLFASSGEKTPRTRRSNKTHGPP